MVDFGSLRHVAAASRQVATYSAMNPILWKAAICSPVAMVCSVFAAEPLNYLLFALSSVPILVGAWGFVHFARIDPRRLQSEGHIEQMEIISKISDNRTGRILELDPLAAPSANTEGVGK